MFSYTALACSASSYASLVCSFSKRMRSISEISNDILSKQSLPASSVNLNLVVSKRCGVPAASATSSYNMYGLLHARAFLSSSTKRAAVCASNNSASVLPTTSSDFTFPAYSTNA